MYHAAVLTVSDRVSRGERPDEGGPLVAELLKNAGYEVVRTDVVPDEQAQIEAALRQMSDGGDIQLLVTTGGTGFAPRDVTPEATLAVCDRLTPGIPEAMRYASMQITSRAMLSRAQAGIRKGTLIVNLPGSPKAAKENLEAVLPTIGHGLEMLSGRPADCAKLVQKYKHAKTVTEKQQGNLDYTDLYDKRDYLNLPEWSVADVNGDLAQCGLSGSPTKVKAIQNIVFQAKESKTISGSDRDVEELIVELLANHTIG